MTAPLCAVDVPAMLALNLGTGAMLVLAAVSILIRQRHFSTHGKEAIGVLVFFITVAAGLRFAAVNFPDTLSSDWNRLLNGLSALGCAAIQFQTWWQAEMELRAANLRGKGIDLLRHM